MTGQVLDKASEQARLAPARKTRHVWSSNPAVVLWGTPGARHPARRHPGRSSSLGSTAT
jgi:hypothetical protein